MKRRKAFINVLMNNRELNGYEKISISLEIPEDFWNTDVTKSREFYVMRIHDGEITRKNDLLRLIQNDPAFIPSWMKGRNHSVTIKGFGSAYAFDPLKINLNLNSWEK